MAEPDLSLREAYVTLALVPGVGCTRLQALIARFGSADRVLRASLEDLRGVVAATVAASIRAADRAATERALATGDGMGARVLIPDDASYPAMLRTIPNPPPLLFVQGDLDLLTRPAVAIVGSRDHTRYGAEVGRAIARAAVEAGLVVVSGMARGLDAIAHLGALDGGGATIGVLGNGLGVISPSAHRELYERVARQGLLVSEFPPGERPSAGSFPRRNRLISGLARVTVVVEAAASSGALGTVEWAQSQGREVLAVPGPITSPVSAGTNALLRDGAGPLLELQDLLDHYPEVASARGAAARRPEPHDRTLFNRLLAALQSEPLPAEQLIERCGAPVDEALEALSVLELGGRVRQEAGWYRAAAGGLFR